VLVGLPEELVESLKKISPHRRDLNEDIATVTPVTFALQIAEGSEFIQGASDDRFRDAHPFRQTTHSMRSGRQSDAEHDTHLAIGEIWQF
jgi:hypothetical protein